MKSSDKINPESKPSSTPPVDKAGASSKQAGSAFSPPKKGRGKGFRYLLLTALLVMLSGWIYAFWVQYSLNRDHQQAVASLSEKAVVFGDETQKELLRFSLKSAGLGIRSEWIRNNQEQIDLYLGNLAQHPRVEIAQVIENNGNVLISSDKHLQGTRFKAQGLESDPLQRKETSYYQVRPEEAWVFTPVMGIDKRLGTLMIQYQTRVFSLEEPSDKPEILYEPTEEKSQPSAPAVLDSGMNAEPGPLKSDTLAKE